MKGRVTVFATDKMISVGSDSIEDSINKLNQAKFYLLKEKLVKNVELEPAVRNIVSTMNYVEPLNLKRLAKNMPNSVYEPEFFAGLRFKIKEGLTALIFSSGKIVIAGGRSVEEIKHATISIKKTLDKITNEVLITISHLK